MNNITNGTFTLGQRLEVINLFCSSSDILVFSCKKIANTPFINFEVEFEKRILQLHLYLKNIVDSGWTDKPYIKRIQIKSLSNVSVFGNKENNLSILVGICLLNEKPIICVWNPFMFTFHKSNRSAYVLVEDIVSASIKGIVKTTYAGKNLILCDQSNFKSLLKQYIQDNYLE